MAVLSKNGTELVRWQEVIQYPADNVDCIVERIRVYSFRSNGHILRKTITVSTLFDKPDRFSTNWTRYKKCSKDNLQDAADRIKANLIKNNKPFNLSSGAVLTYHIN